VCRCSVCAGLGVAPNKLSLLFRLLLCPSLASSYGLLRSSLCIDHNCSACKLSSLYFFACHSVHRLPFLIALALIPYVISVLTGNCSVCTGLGVAPNKLSSIYGTVKAYCTRVGEGPFPTELHDDTGEALHVCVLVTACFKG
jgi:Adenylosuccinate synthetase